MVSGWVRPDAPDSVRSRVAAIQRRNYQLHASGPEAEWAPGPLDEDPALLGAIECPVLLAAGEHDTAAATSPPWKRPRSSAGSCSRTSAS